MFTNAFIGKPKKPTAKQLSTTLGSAKPLWDQLLANAAADLGVTTREWNSYSTKAGWALKVKRGDRTIFYMSPAAGSFLVSFALGDKAIKAALASGLPPEVVKIIKEAKRYAEGTAVRIEVKSTPDLAAIQALATIKSRTDVHAGNVEPAASRRRPAFSF